MLRFPHNKKINHCSQENECVCWEECELVFRDSTCSASVVVKPSAAVCRMLC